MLEHLRRRGRDRLEVRLEVRLLAAAWARQLLMPDMNVALADLTSAYRTIPTSQPEFTAVGVYSDRR